MSGGNGASSRGYPPQPFKFDAADAGQFREPGLDCFPDHRTFPNKVFVRQDVAHGEDLTPRHVWMSCLQFIPKISGCLTDRQNPISDRILNVGIGEKIFAAEVRYLPVNPVYQFEYIQQAVDIRGIGHQNI